MGPACSLVIYRAGLVTIIMILGFALAGCGFSRAVTAPFHGPSVVDWNDTKWCVPQRLKNVITDVSRRFGPVTISSTKRWRGENRRKNGARKSWHLKCKAVDFRVKGNPAGVLAYLKQHPNVGGYKRYSSGFFHIDIGPRRTW